VRHNLDSAVGKTDAVRSWVGFKIIN
jgi:hypothetical protein